MNNMSDNPFSLSGKNVLVTGASSGIGKVTAIECSKMGATVIITGRNQERLDETFSSLVGTGHKQIVADLTLENELEKLVEQLPVLDGCVNNAGIGITVPIQFFSMENMEKIYQTNFFAPVLLTRLLIKKKKMGKPSSIVFTSSISHMLREAGNGIYGCSKASLETFMKFAAKEFAIKKIRCNSVNPGMVHTPLIHEGTLSKEQLEEDMKKYPLKRYGEPLDIAYGIIYLLSDASSWVTGHTLVIDGGRTL